MGMAEKVRALLAAKGMSMADLASKLEPATSRQNIHGKLKRDNLSEQDLQDIARACGVRFEGCFIFEDGTRL